MREYGYSKQNCNFACLGKKKNQGFFRKLQNACLDEKIKIKIN